MVAKTRFGRCVQHDMYFLYLAIQALNRPTLSPTKLNHQTLFLGPFYHTKEKPRRLWLNDVPASRNEEFRHRPSHRAFETEVNYRPRFHFNAPDPQTVKCINTRV